MSNVSVPGILLSILLVVVILELIREKKLFAGYSLLWIFGGFVVFVLSIFPALINIISKMFGIAYGPSALYIVIFLFLFIILIDYSVKFSTLNKQVKDLATTIALLQEKIEDKK